MTRKRAAAASNVNGKERQFRDYSLRASSPAQPGWPQLHASSSVSPASWQYVLQYLLSFAAIQLQAGWAHFLFSDIHPPSSRREKQSAWIRRERAPQRAMWLEDGRVHASCFKPIHRGRSLVYTFLVIRFGTAGTVKSNRIVWLHGSSWAEPVSAPVWVLKT